MGTETKLRFASVISSWGRWILPNSIQLCLTVGVISVPGGVRLTVSFVPSAHFHFIFQSCQPDFP